MTLDELREKYGNIELKEGFEDFIVKSKTGKVFDNCEIEESELLWFLDSDGDVYSFGWLEISNAQFLEMKQGNVFYDEKSAIEERKRREVYHAVEKYAHKFSKQEWKKNLKNKYYPYYYYPAEAIETNFVSVGQRTGLYFETEEDIQKAIAEVGEEDFIKYYLGVEL